MRSTDSLVVGYLKYYSDIRTGQQGIEVWKTKNDKNPKRILKQDVSEYAINKDSFKVFVHLKPFRDGEIYFEAIDAVVISRGKVNLYKVRNYVDTERISTYTGGGLIPAIIDEANGHPAYTYPYSYMYLIEDNEVGNVQGLPSDKRKLFDALAEFFPLQYLQRYSELKSEIKYKTVPDLVRLYNSR